MPIARFIQRMHKVRIQHINENLSYVPIKGNRFLFEDSTDHNKCWKCGASKAEKLFCETCSSLQKPNTGSNFFEILGVHKDYDLKSVELTKKFKDMQKVLHPDKFGTKEKEEIEVSEEYSSLVNQAYSILLNPLDRGLYLLKLEGLSIEEETIRMESVFLMEIMEKNEELEEITNDRNKILQLVEENQKVMDNLSKEISAAFKTRNFHEAKYLLSKMKYYWSIEQKIKSIKEKFGIVM